MTIQTHNRLKMPHFCCGYPDVGSLSQRPFGIAATPAKAIEGLAVITGFLT